MTKIIKESVDIFAGALLSSFNDSVEKFNSPSSLKIANTTPAFKKGDENSKDQLAYFRMCLKHLSDAFFVNYTVLCLNSGQNTRPVG